MFERVVTSRIIGHMGADGGRNDLSPNQYGFRAARSTIDVLVRVCDAIKETLRRGGVAIAVSIDVKNAFNSIPWSAIRDGLVSKSVGCSLICYADDTLLLATGREWAEVRDRAEAELDATVEVIRSIGLRVSLPKMEACGFHRPRNRHPNGLALSTEGVMIGVGRTLKYVGLTFASGLTFG